MSLTARIRQEWLKLRWYGVMFVDWLGYLSRSRAFRAAATKTTVHILMRSLLETESTSTPYPLAVRGGPHDCQPDRGTWRAGARTAS